jgi:hypothetical protein
MNPQRANGCASSAHQRFDRQARALSLDRPPSYKLNAAASKHFRKQISAALS